MSRYDKKQKIRKFTPWSFDAKEQYNCEGFAEGRGEKAYLIQLGIDRQPCGSKGPDLFHHEIGTDAHGDVKCVETKDGKIINSFRTGGAGDMIVKFFDAYDLVRDWNIEAIKGHRYLPFIDADILLAFRRGQASYKEIARLPEELREKVLNVWNPNEILNYGRIVLTSSHGFIEISPQMYSTVFKLNPTSQCRFNFGIDWNSLPDV